MPDEAAVSAGPARMNVPQRMVLRAIRGYQLLFAPMYSGACRFVPSCSAYAFEAVERYGVLRGGTLGVRRLLRCHPFGGHGHDPVPAFAPLELRRRQPHDPEAELQRRGLSDSKTH